MCVCVLGGGLRHHILTHYPRDSDSTKRSRSSDLDRDQTALNDRQPKWSRGFRGLEKAACWDQDTELALGDTRHITYISILIPKGGFRWGLGVCSGRMWWKSSGGAKAVGVTYIAKSSKIIIFLEFKKVTLLRTLQ